MVGAEPVNSMGGGRPRWTQLIETCSAYAMSKTQGTSYKNLEFENLMKKRRWTAAHARILSLKPA